MSSTQLTLRTVASGEKIFPLPAHGRSHESFSAAAEPESFATDRHAVYGAIKRFVEPALAAAALILVTPLLALIAILIKLDDRGPIMFRQARAGKDGRPFSILKFRTMRCEAGQSQRMVVTRLGRLLRDRGLDELPQLLSVITGDMQLIGPRPELLSLAEAYSAHQRLRLQLTPGITGLWQVCAPKGEPIDAHLEFDLYYIQNRSVALDLWIIKETLKIMTGFRGR